MIKARLTYEPDHVTISVKGHASVVPHGDIEGTRVCAAVSFLTQLTAEMMRYYAGEEAVDTSVDDYGAADGELTIRCVRPRTPEESGIIDEWEYGMRLIANSYPSRVEFQEDRRPI